MKLITFQDVEKLNISAEDCYAWTSEMILHKNDALLPTKIGMKPAEGVFCNVMPCIVPDTVIGNVAGVKIVTRYPDRQPSLDGKLMLMDADNGEFLALMDGDWITTMRTGAVAAHSVLLFARENFTEIGMMGLWNTARAALLILVSQIKDRDLNIKLLRHKGQEEDFRNRFEFCENLHFTYVDTPAEVIRHSEVVISAVTYTADDFCADEDFDEGVLVVPIHTRGFTNCDLFFDKVYADDTGHVHNFKNFDKFRKFAEVTDVVTGRTPGRENEKERILAYNIGVSMHDINFAAYIYSLLKDNESLPEIELKQPEKKFWV